MFVLTGGVRKTQRWLWKCACLLMAVCLPSRAQVTVNVTIEGLAGASNPTTTNLAQAIRSHMVEGLHTWTRWMPITGPRSIEAVVRIVIYPTGTGGGRSVTSSFVERDGAINVFEQGVAAELRTGMDPSGTNYDAEITIDPRYLRDQLWFDPDPLARVAPVPNNRIDAMSFFAHEFGHALGFTGWKDQRTGRLPGDYQSTFDQRRRFDGTNWWWTGPEANRLFGGDVPLSRVGNNFDHYGNPAGFPGNVPVLVDGLMNGVVFNWGQRYRLGLLDLVMLRDTGLALSDQLVLSPPALAITAEASGARRLSWLATPLANYTVARRGALLGGWTNIGTVSFPGPLRGSTTYDDSTPATTSQFYRLSVGP
jgi:hypothetical protein